MEIIKKGKKVWEKQNKFLTFFVGYFLILLGLFFLYNYLLPYEIVEFLNFNSYYYPIDVLVGFFFFLMGLFLIKFNFSFFKIYYNISLIGLSVIYVLTFIADIIYFIRGGSFRLYEMEDGIFLAFFSWFGIPFLLIFFIVISATLIKIFFRKINFKLSKK